MEDLEKQMSKLDQMFEEGKNIRKPYIISHNQPLSDVSEEYIENEEKKIFDLEMDAQRRKEELLDLRKSQEETLLQKMQKSTVRINSIKNFLGTINKKAIKKIKKEEIKENILKEDAIKLVENFDKKIEENTKIELKETDNVPSISQSQKSNFSKNSLIDIPKVLLFKMRNSKVNGKDDILFNLEKENEIEHSISQGKSRTLKKNGSIFSSILITVTTLTVGIILALTLLK